MSDSSAGIVDAADDRVRSSRVRGIDVSGPLWHPDASSPADRIASSVAERGDHIGSQ